MNKRQQTYIVLLSSLSDHELADSHWTRLDDVAENVDGGRLDLNIIHRLQQHRHATND